MVLTPAKHKSRVLALLYVCTQNSLYIFFRVSDYLLKLVYRHNTTFIGRFEVSENFFQ